MKFQTSLVLLGCTALSFMIPLSAQASCYGSVFSRICDGIGGYGATYPKPSSNGITDYVDNNGLNKTLIRSSLGTDLKILETIRYRYR
jgi:hypothetical protein